MIPTVVRDFYWLKQSSWLLIRCLIPLAYLTALHTLLDIGGDSIAALHIVLCPVITDVLAVV